MGWAGRPWTGALLTAFRIFAAICRGRGQTRVTRASGALQAHCALGRRGAAGASPEQRQASPLPLALPWSRA